jgi:hypothetical protein
MPDRRMHRGPHPADEKLFVPGAVSALREAIADYSMLLTKNYAEKSSLKLVGDKFSLTQRQRLAIMRSACSDRQLTSRQHRRIAIGDLRGRPVAVDGYNILITVEAAMSGGVIFKGRDGCYRDLASIHGTYRKVAETVPGLSLIGAFMEEVGAGGALWLLDSPVSNSGRLKTLIGRLAGDNNWNWQVELVTSPDARLIKDQVVAASSDSVVLDGCSRWVNLATEIIMSKLPSAWVIDLSDRR